MKERSYADLADSATNFDPELEYDKQVDKILAKKGCNHDGINDELLNQEEPNED